MPVARFVCPYCEKPAEVQVTSVTRSRPCPHCSKGVVIQVAARDRKGKHRALLIAPSGQPIVVDEAELHSKPMPGPAYEPMPLEGEVFERMKMDPEIRRFRRRLYIGVAAVAALIIAVSFWSSLVPQGEPVVVDSPSSAPADESKPDAGAEPKAPVSIQPGLTARPTAANGVLTFHTTGGSSQPVTTPGSTGDSSRLILSVVEKLLRADHVDILLETVAARQSIEPAVRRHVAAHGVHPVDYRSMQVAPAAQVLEGCDAKVVIDLKDGSRRDAHIIMENAVPRVDWPSFVALSEMEWSKFMADAPSNPILFRVLAGEGDRFENAFSERTAVRCLKLQDPNNAAGPPLFAYVEKASNVGEELDFVLRQSTERPVRLTLRLRFPADPLSHDQVWIDSMVASGWVIDREPGASQVSVAR